MKKLSDRSKNQIRKFLEAEGVAIGNQFRWEFYWRKCDLERKIQTQMKTRSEMKLWSTQIKRY